MDWMYLFYFSLALLIFFGARSAGKVPGTRNIRP